MYRINISLVDNCYRLILFVFSETLDICSKYLSQCAIDQSECIRAIKSYLSFCLLVYFIGAYLLAVERGPAFDLLIKELERDGSAPFTPQFDPLNCKYAAGYVLVKNLY